MHFAGYDEALEIAAPPAKVCGVVDIRDERGARVEPGVDPATLSRGAVRRFGGSGDCRFGQTLKVVLGAAQFLK